MNQYEKYTLLIATASLLISLGNLSWLFFDAWRKHQAEKPKIATKIKRTTIQAINGVKTAEWWGHIDNYDREPVNIIDCGFQIWRSGYLIDDSQRAFGLPREIPAGDHFTFSQSAEDIACTLRRAGHGGQVWIRAFCKDAYRNDHVSSYTAFNIDDFSCP